jgi:hypothetical protein
LLDGLQLIPTGLLVTWPLPAPFSVTLKAKGISVKVAVTLCAAFIATTQVPVPPHPPPDQPPKVDMAFGAAVNVTCIPCSKLAEQAGPQLIPEGLLITVPVPLPVVATDSMKLGITVKVAVTLSAAFTVVTQGAVPMHPPPDQPAKVDPLAAEAEPVPERLTVSR